VPAQRAGGRRFWGIGTHLGRGLSQSVMGDRLGHVKDFSREDPGARAYRNKQELSPACPGYLKDHIKPLECGGADVFESIRNYRMFKHQIVIDDDNILLTISYDVSQRFMSGRHLTYNVALSRKKNPLWTQLVKKATQLEAAASIAQIGIIACDAGCSLFNRNAALGTFTATDIIQQFFSEHPTVTFVLLLTVKRTAHQEPVFRIEPSFYSPRPDSDTIRLRTTLSDALARLPKPVLDPLNAYIQRRETGYPCGRLGVFTLRGNSVKISARTILELLAGRRTPSEINESFERLLQQGRMITRIRVEKSEDDSDDDWLTIEFGKPDPAISPFVVKPKSAR
jgi:hypothetical protein